MNRPLGWSAAQSLGLFGRSRELSATRERIEAAAAGSRQVLLVRGPSGVGKTALISEALAGATLPLGTTSLFASCTGGGASSAYDLVRKLFAPLDCTRSGHRLLRGGARRALPALVSGKDAAPGLGGSTAHSIMHGLYRLAGHLFESGPLLIAVDDIQWADPESLCWIGYLLRRTQGRPLCVVLSECLPVTSSMSALVGEALTDDTAVLTLEPLGLPAIEEWVHARRGCYPAPELVEELHRLSGGNARTLERLLARVPSDATTAHHGPITELGQAIAVGAAVDWVAGQPARINRVVRAVAVLDSVDVDLVAGLSSASGPEVESVLELLRDNDVLNPVGDGFSHDEVRSAILRCCPAEELARLRVRATRLLNDAGRCSESVATYPLPGDAGEHWMQVVLSGASARAERRGALEPAARCTEPLVQVTPTCVDLRVRLGELLTRCQPDIALGHMRLAHEYTTDVRTRARIVSRNVVAALPLRRSIAAPDLAGPALDALVSAVHAHPEPGDDELLLQARAALLIAGLMENRPVQRIHDRMREFTEPAGDTPGQRQMLAVMSFVDMLRGDLRTAMRRSCRAVLVGVGADGGYGSVASALTMGFAGESMAALAALDQVLARATEAGNTALRRGTLTARAVVLINLGRFAETILDSRAALEIRDRADWCADYVGPSALLARALVHTGEPAKARDILARIVSHGDDRTLTKAVVRMAHAEVRIACDDIDGALADLLACGSMLAASGIENPVITPWWVEAALLLSDHGRQSEAVGHVEHGARLTTRWNVPQARGLLSLARAAIAEGTAAIALGREAVRVLAGSPANYDCQRARHRLGAALLRAGELPEAREHLRIAVELATRCGMAPAAAAARRLLVEAGGRGHQAHASGASVLTRSERRVADMAMAGATNREIARALYVTPRTVEVHLTSTYRKLGIDGRAGLPSALVPAHRHMKVRSDAG